MDLLDLLDHAPRCRFCGEDPHEPDHERRCNGRQGLVEGLYATQGDVPFEAASATSAEAAAHLNPDDLARLERLVYDTLQTPRTCDEVEAITGLAHQTASARIRGLVLRQQIVDSGEKRLTRRNRRAVVWRISA